jgi:hypothetical protein
MGSFGRYVMGSISLSVFRALFGSAKAVSKSVCNVVQSPQALLGMIPAVACVCACSTQYCAHAPGVPSVM